MDCPMYGAGSCALQVTIQCANVDEARYLYDQLIPIGPVMLALTAGTPAYRGYLAATDARWNTTSTAFDDRTPEERGMLPLRGDQQRIPKPRFSSNSTYLSSSPRLRHEYHDPALPINRRVKKKLIAGGMDDIMATHFAHIFIRDPLIVFMEDWMRLKPQETSDSGDESPHEQNGLNGLHTAAPDTSSPPERIYATAFHPAYSQPSSASASADPVQPVDPDPDSTEYFEKIHSMDWPHVRFKPPPPNSPRTGWRVEFRVMEVQVTDFENAAFSIWIMLLARAILHYDVNLYVPIARVAESMDAAHAVDAAHHAKLYFRKDICGGDETFPGPVKDEYELKSVDQIINGRAGGFPGLASLVRRYVDEQYVAANPSERRRLEEYQRLVEQRASGRVETLAHWMRRFVRTHPDYEKDSVISERVEWDLMRELRDITRDGGRGEKAPGFCRAAAVDGERDLR